MGENKKGNYEVTIEKRRIIKDNPERKGILGALKVNEPKKIEKEYDFEVYKADQPSDK